MRQRNRAFITRRVREIVPIERALGRQLQIFPDSLVTSHERDEISSRERERERERERDADEAR